MDISLILVVYTAADGEAQVSPNHRLRDEKQRRMKSALFRQATIFVFAFFWLLLLTFYELDNLNPKSVLWIALTWVLMTAVSIIGIAFKAKEIVEHISIILDTLKETNKMIAVYLAASSMVCTTCHYVAVIWNGVKYSLGNRLVYRRTLQKTSVIALLFQLLGIILLGWYHKCSLKSPLLKSAAIFLTMCLFTALVIALLTSAEDDILTRRYVLIGSVIFEMIMTPVILYLQNLFKVR